MVWLPQIVVQQARECYAPEVVVELQSATEEQCLANVEEIFAKVQAWSPQGRSKGADRSGGSSRYDPY
eukprot:SAG31_NODE_12333_length_949_cov_1.169412_2_plen_68_part_00